MTFKRTGMLIGMASTMIALAGCATPTPEQLLTADYGPPPYRLITTMQF